MISFYPGPSRVFDAIPGYVRDAHKNGILSVNHRSQDFMAMSKKTIALLKQRLAIPKAYSVFFTSSATECWEILAQSVLQNNSIHFYNGAFGQKWFEYTRKLHRGAVPSPFELNELPNEETIPGDFRGIVCVTQNETSNGTQLTSRWQQALRSRCAGALIAVDATSSMGGVKLDFKSADIWFASVQKCFGLPAGLGLMICSPAALERAARINERDHYNSLPFMMEMMEKWQTPFTPNVLGIYLLMRVLEDNPGVGETEKVLQKRSSSWVDFLEDRRAISNLIKNHEVRSTTVLAVTAEEGLVSDIKKKAKKNGLLLGEGYGAFKPYTFRIANFPALKDSEIKTLKSFLQKY